MPSRTLPTFTRAEVEAHNSASSCYVTIGTKVFDITDFVSDHPGGGQLILDYAGKDVEKILKDSVSHDHTETAYEILDDSLVGFVLSEKSAAAAANGTPANGKAATNGTLVNGASASASATTSASASANGESSESEGEGFVHPRTGLSCVEDLEKDTDFDKDFKTHKFLDMNKPLFMQVWRGNFTKEFYLEQVHRPRHYKGGQSAPLFGNFLEPLTKTPWWVIPIIWLPVVSYCAYLASEGLSRPVQAAIWVFGFFLFTLIEYAMHRFLFHIDDVLPDNRWGITAHFLLHGIHHYIPMDRYRLVMPPTLAVVLIAPFWPLAHTVFPNWHVATTVFSGALCGYVAYDVTHYALHHQTLPLWYKGLKKYHLEHHFQDYENGYGITTRFWDRVFGTELQPKVLKTQ